ncbi:interferon alpha-inducible protein 27-like protein 1 isoform X3 [Electrophorus electricus]|uniref:interferon alpha-inducible protein 27-like protein 1 isoform X3 n=1 Tax=Electrophorus electricus TaxID=8005 RepID=UPI0015D05DA2|nr:interferon alpha-inducible protein 27-like protein 1 isoform X3 [Electrophorus electricus]
MRNKRCAAAAGTAGTLALAHGTLLTRGFTSAGIAASSAGAGMMSSAAIANGGGVAASGLVALLQSAGAAGLSTSIKMTVAFAA